MMKSTRQRLEEWARGMGYRGAFPDATSIKAYCHPQTEYIWEQVISAVKPRYEIELVRRKVVANRLRNPNCRRATAAAEPLEEIVAYERLQEAKTKAAKLHKLTDAKQFQLGALRLDGDALRVQIEQRKQTIRATHAKELLMRTKIAEMRQTIGELAAKINTPRTAETTFTSDFGGNLESRLTGIECDDEGVVRQQVKAICDEKLTLSSSVDRRRCVNGINREMARLLHKWRVAQASFSPSHDSQAAINRKHLTRIKLCLTILETDEECKTGDAEILRTLHTTTFSNISVTCGRSTKRNCLLKAQIAALQAMHQQFDRFYAQFIAQFKRKETKSSSDNIEMIKRYRKNLLAIETAIGGVREAMVQRLKMQWQSKHQLLVDNVRNHLFGEQFVVRQELDALQQIELLLQTNGNRIAFDHLSPEEIDRLTFIGLPTLTTMHITSRLLQMLEIQSHNQHRNDNHDKKVDFSVVPDRQLEESVQATAKKLDDLLWNLTRHVDVERKRIDSNVNLWLEMPFGLHIPCIKEFSDKCRMLHQAADVTQQAAIYKRMK